jgi:hypothetical protein
MAPTPVSRSCPTPGARRPGATSARSVHAHRHETELFAHVDTDYYWWHHLRVRVTILTTPTLVFEVGADARTWTPTRWVFDTWRPCVDNPPPVSASVW